MQRYDVFTKYPLQNVAETLLFVTHVEKTAFFTNYFGNFMLLCYLCIAKMLHEKKNLKTLPMMKKRQEALERQLEIAEKKLGILRDVTQEVRTPLALIITPLLSLMQEDDDPHRRSIYETIRRNAERLLSLIDQIIDLGKAEQGVLTMHMKETDIIDYTNNIMAMFAQKAKAKMIFMNFYHDMTALNVWIDRKQFDKVLVNLLNNSFKYMAVGGTLDIRVEQREEHVCIKIRDNGVGIPEEALPVVFNHFYEANLSLEERNITSGIRLDLVNRLVNLHHGSISVQNNEEGGGCEFTILLPLGNKHLSEEEMAPVADDTEEEEPHINERGESVAKAPKKRQRQRIVLIESEVDVSDFLINELQQDYDVTLCATGKEGLAAIGTKNPDLVVSDLRISDMDGHAICAHLKSNSATFHIPFIMLTSNSPHQDRLELLEAAADAYIMRPFNMDILRRTIINLLYRQQTLKLKFGRNDMLEEMVDDVQVKSPDDRLMERVMAVINSNLTNTEMSVDMIAYSVGLSRVHLHRKMKELTGQTPHDFIRGIRLKKASQLLRRGDISVTEVVYACGFGSAASFSTIFKKQFGLSPREYMMKVNSKE